MTSALFVIGCISGVVYGIFVDGTFFKIYFAILAFYTVVFGNFLVDRKQSIKRKNMNITSWNGIVSYVTLIAPTDPTVYLVQDVDVTKALEYVKKLK